MVRDLELIRSILLKVEQGSIRGIKSKEIAIEEPTAEAVAYHVKLLIDAGYTEGVSTGEMLGPPSYLKIKSDMVWPRFSGRCQSSKAWAATTSAMKTVGGWTIEVVKAYLEQQLKTALGLRAGGE